MRKTLSKAFKKKAYFLLNTLYIYICICIYIYIYIYIPIYIYYNKCCLKRLEYVIMLKLI